MTREEKCTILLDWLAWALSSGIANDFMLRDSIPFVHAALKRARSKGKRLSRSAKTGRTVTAAYAKKHPATTVKEKREEALWKGWALIHEDGRMPWFWKFQPPDQLAIRVKLVRA
jgi:hypothetical protein